MAKIDLTRKMYNEAFSQRMTFSRYLETLDPSGDGDKLDAFERQLKERGIITRSNYAKGINASTVEEAFGGGYRTEDNDILFPEYIGRTVREVMTNDVMLAALIGQYTTINSNAYKSIWCDDQPDEARFKRVTESSNLPKAKIKTRETEVKIYKYGRAIEASYEVIRRMQLDLLAKHVGRFGAQAAKDKVSEILTVVQDGDGNNNAAPTLNLTALDTETTTGNLTAKAWINFLMQFEEFPANTIIASKDAFLAILLTDLGTMSAADVLKVLSQGATSGISLTIPQLPKNNINMFWHPDVADGKVIGMNKENTIEQITEAGSDIHEADRFITNQTQILTMSENSGFSKMFKEAAKVMDLGA